MKTTLLFSALSLACASAFATGTPFTPEPVIPTLPPITNNAAASQEMGQGQDQGQHQGQGQNQNASASVNANQNANSNANQTSSNSYYSPSTSNARSYSVFSSASATPLPAGVCPKGDSVYVQVFFGLFTYSTSSTRTEMECLEQMIALVRAHNPAPVVQQIVLAPGEQVHPVCTPAKNKPPVILPGGKKRPQLTCEKWIKKAP
jgi:hypothetical protein